MTAAPDALHASRSIALDCIRTIAILSVFSFHVASRYEPVDLDPIAKILQRVGFLGVDIFFPLSGFLITRFLISSPRADFIKTFFLRRAFRILPLYFVALVTFLLANWVTGIDNYSIDRMWVNALFLTGWFIYTDGRQTVPYSITWSLSVEEFSYIILGIAAWISRRHLLPFLIALTALSCTVRFLLLSGDSSSENFRAIYYLPIARLDSIALGGITAVLMQYKRQYAGAAMIFLTAVIFISTSFSILLYRTLLFTEIAAATCVVIVFSETFFLEVRENLLKRFSRIGFYSYFNYLFQFFVIDAFLLFFHQAGLATPPFWITMLITLLITHALAVLSYRFFENPLMNFGRQFELPCKSDDPSRALSSLD